MENYKQWMEQKLTSEDMDKLPKVYKPLTKEQIILIMKNNGWNTDEPNDIIELVHAVEDAHGIK
jgi:hypothetical protein